MISPYCALLLTTTFTLFPLNTSPVVHEYKKLFPEYISNHPEVRGGRKLMLADTHVSIPLTVTVLPVYVFICTPEILRKLNDPVVGLTLGSLVVRVRGRGPEVPIVTAQVMV